MRIVVLYLRIIRQSVEEYQPPKDYDVATRQWLASYQKFKPSLAHDLLICNAGADRPDDLLDCVSTWQATTVSEGWDCGQYQEVNPILKGYDLVVAMNTHSFLWRDGWLELLAAAAAQHGPGVYGPSASYELQPHLRTPCIAYHPEVLAQYPAICRTRNGSRAFEHGPVNFSLWAHKHGYPTLLVTSDGNTWKLPAWRLPPNIFRRGDQSNVPVWDRHTELYAGASAQDRAMFERGADGLDKPLTKLAAKV